MLNGLRMAMVAALLLAAGDAAALGLGRIEVKSRLNQPLLAEIPVISNDPSELSELRARMASPDTFRRVGLQPPQGVAAELNFSLGRDARGRPVIRVTSVAPVDQAVLNFLIEVDWGQGRLVREYSALVDVPNTAGATLPPPVSAPVMAAPNLVQRPEVGVAEALPPAPQPMSEPESMPAAEPMAGPESEPAPAPVPEAVAAAPSAEPVPAAPEAGSDAVDAGEYGPVKRGETLSKIAGALGLEGFSLNQTMLGLLRANPDAFLGENINRLKQGSVLRVPDSSELGTVAADEAGLVVREQMRQWRQSRRPVPQPQAAVASDAGGSGDVAGTSRGTQAKPAAAPKPARDTAADAASGQQARLEILPPSVDGKAAGTQSGASAGGEGKMLQQQLQQRDEDIAAKSAEISELKNRVAELEELQGKQQQLLSMKDSELAAAQKALEEARKAQAAAPATTVQPATPSAQQAGDAGASPWPWAWGGLGLLAVAALAYLFGRRGEPAKAAGGKPVAKTEPRRSFDSAALAAAVPKASSEASSTSPVASEPAKPGDAPAWHAGSRSSSPTQEPVDVPGGEPNPGSAEQRLKLARAFLDIGDDSSARQLLRELLLDPDPAARSDAQRLLRELGD